MAYSKGMVDIYKEAGYEAIVMEWNNPYRFHREWEKEWLYKPQIAQGIKHKLPVVWADSIAFQKLQRFVHGEIPLREYFDYLKTHTSKVKRFFPLYANDVEIFNFRPGRYETEANRKFDEWRRIKRVLDFLKSKDFGFAFIEDVLKHTQNNILNLESPQQPIPVKKQEKYNINRWALTGRDDLGINTKIFRLLRIFDKKKPTKEDWKKLLYFASSDFRTHITQERWGRFNRKFEKFLDMWDAKPVHFVVKSNKKNNFKIKQDLFYFSIESGKLSCIFNKNKGLTAKSIVFIDKSDKPLLGTLPHGYYDDISLGADFFSFHAIIEKPGEHKITNLCDSTPSTVVFADRVKIENVCFNKGVKFYKACEVFSDRFKIYLKIELPNRDFAIIHPLNVTFNPEAFDRDTLFFATHNGSASLEVFKLKDQPVAHSKSLSILISAKHGLGSTEGMVVVGDKDKSLIFKHNQTLSALVPSIYFLPMKDTYFLRLQYSAQEMDETFKPKEGKQIIECEFLIY